jgi:hypothetical protein
MSRKAARRPGLVQLAVAGKITAAAGAHALTISLGSSGGSRLGIGSKASVGWCTGSGVGPRPGRWTHAVREHVATLVQTTYHELNDCHCTEKLRERQPEHGPPAPTRLGGEEGIRTRVHSPNSGAGYHRRKRGQRAREVVAE